MTEVVAALIRDGRRFLVCQRPAGKARALLWEFAGGKAEPGETREEALVRECREELGITVAPEELYAEVIHSYPDLTIHLSLYRCRIVSGTPRRLEHRAMRWVTPAEAAGLSFCPADIGILRRLLEEDT